MAPPCSVFYLMWGLKGNTASFYIASFFSGGGSGSEFKTVKQFSELLFIVAVTLTEATVHKLPGTAGLPYPN